MTRKRVPNTSAPRRGVRRVRDAAGRVVAGRYVLEVLLGRGGSGVVWRATDRAGGAVVAVKLLAPATPEEEVRLTREIHALRLLRLPGVVRLLDSGADRGESFIVMDLVEGSPFPGRVPRVWEALAPRVCALAEGLRLVHARGIVHRDLKPANVLVDDNGQVTLLDFGLARGGALESTVTDVQTLVGTPRYLAPEQIRGLRVDRRTDLYAIGVMLFELLTGQPPHLEGSLAELAADRLNNAAPPVLGRAPNAPPHVAALVDRLLQRSPAARPQSADEVLIALGGVAPLELPFLGPTTAVDRLIEGATAGRSVDLWGPSGSGRSRTLQEAVRRLRVAAIDVLELVPGDRPLQSLGPLVGDASAVDPLADAEAAVRGVLSAGTVVVVDVPTADAWSNAILERCAAVGPILRIADTPRALLLPPLDEPTLRDLFHGPDAILHLREDAARLLSERTGGWPARVVAEVSMWLGAGIARWDEGRLRVDRLGLDLLEGGLWSHVPFTGTAGRAHGGPLDQLLAWIGLAGPAAHPKPLAAAMGIASWEIDAEIAELRARGAVRTGPTGRLEVNAATELSLWSDSQRVRAHLALAGQLAPGTAGRLEHFAGGGDAAGVADEALHLARELVAAGRVGRAQGLLTVALSIVHVTPGRPREQELAQELTRAALVDGSGPALRAAQYEVGRTADGAAFGSLLAAWALAQGRKGEGDEELAASLSPFDDLELEAFRRLVPIRSLMRRSLDDAEQRIAELVASTSKVLASRGRLALGHVRHQQGRYAEAAELYRSVVADADTPSRRASALINAGNAELEQHRCDRALAAFLAARAIAGEARLAALEGAAAAGEREALYRMVRATEPDLELVGAIEMLDDPSTLGRIALTEAAVAWRQGRLELGANLAARSAAAFDRPGSHKGNLTARGLGAVCLADAAALATVVAESVAYPSIHLHLDALARAMEAGVSIPDASPPPDAWRHGLLAPIEVERFVRPGG